MQRSGASFTIIAIATSLLDVRLLWPTSVAKKGRAILLLVTSVGATIDANPAGKTPACNILLTLPEETITATRPDLARTMLERWGIYGNRTAAGTTGGTVSVVASACPSHRRLSQPSAGGPDREERIHCTGPFTTDGFEEQGLH
jgi:hypothetical protein